ncbi:globin domain-containing protein [Cryptosporangium sp. NPDC048952]|uniref:globin domain-containing protein n=1 Tax=Cryptosporangium sp. NPDC048952 TaxID=3363961 RepID=UPI003718DB54
MTARLPHEDHRPDSTTMSMIRESRTAIAARPVDLAAAVYRHLPSFAPRTKELLAADIRLHGDRIVRDLLRAAEVLDSLAALEDDLRRLGAEHAAHHGVRTELAEHLPYLGQALVRAVRELFPNSEGGPLGSAWLEVFEWLADEMMRGAEAAGPAVPETSPAYWRSYVEPHPPEPPPLAVPAPAVPAPPSEPVATADPAQDATVMFDRGELFERLARIEELPRSVSPAAPVVRPAPPAARPVSLAARPVSPAAPVPRAEPPVARPVPPAAPAAPAAARGGPGRRGRNPWSWASRSRARSVEPEPPAEPWPPPPQIDPAMYDSPPVSTTATAGPTAVGESAVIPPADPEPAPTPGGALKGVGTGWPRTTATRPVRPAQDAELNPLDLGDAPAQE